MLTPGTTAEYGRTQDRCVIVEVDRGRALVRFDDRQEWVNKRMLAWVPSEAEIADGAERIRAANLGLSRPTQAEWDFAINDCGDGV